ncbi:MAG: class I SAM-dependent methyltransferase [Methanobacterium sp.]|nr:class I SAM-dependent methyltransferase [Methanobacterium sp.]
MKQKLEGITETLLIPLWARARESQEKNPIVKDDMAGKMMEQIEYDFQKFEHKRMPQVSIAIRTELLDKATSIFIGKHPDGTVVNLGCGLDTRYFRLETQQIHWYDLDLPEPIRIRKHFFQETEHYKMIARSIFDASWSEDVRKDKPVLFIAEGLLMYFKEKQIKELLEYLTTAFPGAEMLCEVSTPLLVDRHRNMNPQYERHVPFLWGIWNGKEMEEITSRVRFVEEWNYYDYHKERRKQAKISLTREESGRILHLKFMD